MSAPVLPVPAPVADDRVPVVMSVDGRHAVVVAGSGGGRVVSGFASRISALAWADIYAAITDLSGYPQLRLSQVCHRWAATEELSTSDAEIDTVMASIGVHREV